MPAFDSFTLWFAKSLAANTSGAADLKITNTVTVGQEISLIYCKPLSFAKRSTDTTNALSVDPKSPDTGTGMSDIIIRFAEQRRVALANPVLERLLDMFYNKGNDDDFEFGRFGLINTDNPILNVLPIATAGYKFISYDQDPNQDQPAIQVYNVHLKFLGDHSKLGTGS